MGLEKTSRKKLTAVAFEGRQMTQTKAQQNYILRDGLGSREMFFYEEQGQERWVGSWSATGSAETKFTPSIKGVMCKT